MPEHEQNADPVRVHDDMLDLATERLNADDVPRPQRNTCVGCPDDKGTSYCTAPLTPTPAPAVIIVPVQVLKRFIRDATLRENQAVTKLLRMEGVVTPTAQNDGSGATDG